MGFLSAWIVSIVGIVILGVLVDIIITDGQTAKYIKSVFAIITVFVIASPIPKIINGDLNIESVFEQVDPAALDQRYLDYLFELKGDQVVYETKKLVTAHAITDFEVKCNAVNENGNLIIKNIKIVINGTYPHINIINQIVQETADKFNLEKGSVTVDGRE